MPGGLPDFFHQLYHSQVATFCCRFRHVSAGEGFASWQRFANPCIFVLMDLLDLLVITLPETNIALENNPLEKEVPIGNPSSFGAMLVLGSV